MAARSPRRWIVGHAILAAREGGRRAEINHRLAPVATLGNGFYVELHGESTRADYPRDDIKAVLKAAQTY